MTRFPQKIVERCAQALRARPNANWKFEPEHMATCVLEASGHAELVEALDAMLVASQPQAAGFVFLGEAQALAAAALAKARGEA